MRRLPLLLLLPAFAFLAPLGAAWPEPTVVTLTGIDEVQSLKRADVDGDGIVDLLLLSGRRLQIWRGTKGALPAAKPAWSVTLARGVSFVSAPSFPLAGARRKPGEATVYTVGTDGLQMVTWGAKGLRVEQGVGPVTMPGYHPPHSITWRDGERATFADLARGDGVLAPSRAGWGWYGAATHVSLALPRYRRVEPPGPFLEDTSTVSDGLPDVFVGAPATAGAKGVALWAIAGGKLLAQAQGERVTYDLSFLGAGDRGDFDQTLVDLDGDNRPEVLHRIFTNREVHYGFFRTKPAKGAVGPTHKPAATTLSLQGFQLDPELIDLDGDGLKDLVITSMQVNAANMMTALTSGKIVAETRAFLNRSKTGTSYFVNTPDATIKSELGVKVQFNYAGNIEVIRSLLIVADGDFDGDGRKDLAIRTGPSTLSIHRGLAKGVWATGEQVRTVSIPPLGASPTVEGYAADLDADGRDELVLVYRKAPGGKVPGGKVPGGKGGANKDIVRIVEP